jgi:hypothetical protein
MKQLIVPITIIVALIAFFVIIDRKDFHSGNDVAVQQETVTRMKPTTVTTVKPVEKPVETRPVEKPAEKEPETETKTATTKPVAESKPVETKPVAETKSATAKPVETKPVTEKKPVAETKPATAKPAETKPVETKPVTEEKLIPVAIPIATAEEAKKLNEEAKEYAAAEKEKREPFFRMYENSNFEPVTFEGTIRATSTIPDPLKNDYDNCLYALFIELNSVLSKTEQNNEIPCEAILTVPIMKDKVIISNNVFNPGDMVLCTCAAYDMMPQGIQEIQLSDDIQSYEHQQYYVISVSKIKSFSPDGNKNFAKREITILPVQKLPRDEKLAKTRATRIQNEIKRIEEELKKHGGSFDAWKEEYKAIDSKYKKLCGEDWKGWIGNSYFYARGSEVSNYNTKEYINGIMPYKKYLDENNIDLILIRFPSRSDFAARVLGADEFQENPAWVEHYYECLKNDIEIVDPMPEMWKHRFDYPMFYFYNLPTEQHPFEGETMVAADVLSEVLKRYNPPKEENAISLRETMHKSSDPQYFYPPGNPQFNTEENIVFNQSIQNEKSIKTLQLNSSHPIIFLSNSFLGGSPFREAGASVPSYLSYFLQTKPDWLYQAGIGNAMIRNLISSPELLANRRVVVMVGAFSMWNGAFPPFPKYIADNAKSISLEMTLDFISKYVTNLDNGSFVFTQKENGSTEFTQNTEMEGANKYFQIELNIPQGPAGKKTCMLRINFTGYSTYITMNIQDSESQSIVDTTTLAPGNNLHADVFIPVPIDSRTVSIQFRPSYPDHKFSIKNFELWYY